MDENQRHPLIKFKEHPKGYCCASCVFFEEHRDPMRNRKVMYCRCLPMPAVIKQKETSYWCGHYTNKSGKGSKIHGGTRS